MNEFINKYKVLFLAVAVFLTVSITGISYAYFSAQVTSNNVKQTVITTGTMTIEYDDGDLIGTTENINPGGYIEKYFSVENTGNVATEYVIYLSEVKNSFDPTSDLEYKLEKLSENGYEKEYSECPTSPTSINQTPIALAVGDKHEYKLTIMFKETNAPQDTNHNKMFSAKLSINEYKNATQTITMHPNNGEENYTIAKELGLSFGNIDEPVKENNIIAGLYSDENFTNEVTSSTLVSLDLTDLYVKWKTGVNLKIFDEYIYLDATNGDDSTGDGTITSPYKTLSVLSSVVTTGKSYGIVLSDGTYSLPESVFTLNNDKSINLIGNKENTKLSVGSLFANSSGGSTNYTVGFYRLVWNGTSNASNAIYTNNRLEFNNVAFKLNFTSANYSYFISGTKGYSFTNCSLTPYVSSLIRCSANGIKLTNCYGGYSSGWNTTDSYWNYQTNYITTSPNMDSKYNILDEESVWKGVGTGTNPDGTTANIGVYGGTYSWEFEDNIFN